ncbi:hypothetical protein ABW20_dc0109275 [Dactylellina cionopaga]|nr:hypothetical protein ABW20_dc0109275 [Dactylellina cionopaga]
MAGNLVTRFFGGQSIYESLRQHDRISDDGYNDEPEPFEDGDDFHARLEAGRVTMSRGDNRNADAYNLIGGGFGQRKTSTGSQDAGRISSESDSSARAFLSPSGRPLEAEPRNRPPFVVKPNEVDNDVPESLIIESNRHERVVGTASSDFSSPPPPPEFSRFHDQPTAFEQQLGNLPPPPSRILEERWAAVQNNMSLPLDLRTPVATPKHPPGFIDPKQRAMYKWANVEDVDGFLHRV